MTVILGLACGGPRANVFFFLGGGVPGLSDPAAAGFRLSAAPGPKTSRRVTARTILPSSQRCVALDAVLVCLACWFVTCLC